MSYPTSDVAMGEVKSLKKDESSGFDDYKELSVRDIAPTKKESSRKEQRAKTPFFQEKDNREPKFSLI